MIQGLAVSQHADLPPKLYAWTSDGMVYELTSFGEWIPLPKGPWVKKTIGAPCS